MNTCTVCGETFIATSIICTPDPEEFCSWECAEEAEVTS